MRISPYFGNKVPEYHSFLHLGYTYIFVKFYIEITFLPRLFASLTRNIYKRDNSGQPDARKSSYACTFGSGAPTYFHLHLLFILIFARSICSFAKLRLYSQLSKIPERVHGTQRSLE